MCGPSTAPPQPSGARVRERRCAEHLNERCTAHTHKSANLRLHCGNEASSCKYAEHDSRCTAMRECEHSALSRATALLSTACERGGQRRRWQRGTELRAPGKARCDCRLLEIRPTNVFSSAGEWKCVRNEAGTGRSTS